MLMNDKEKKNLRDDSTTDFFLKVIKEEKITKEKDQTKKEDLENTKNKTVNFVLTAYNSINKLLDRMLSSKHSIMALSLVLTIVLFVTLSGGDVLSSTTSGSTIKNVTVRTEGLKDGYDVTGVPSSVTIGLIGPSLDIYTTKLTKNYEVYVDLAEYGEGTHTVSLKTRNFDSDLTVMLLPETANVKISPKVNAKFSVGYKFINEDELDEKYTVSLASLSQEKVNVSASQATINKIDKVCAVIDVAGKTKAFTQTCALKAYDAEGRELNCSITPSKVKAKCNVDSYSKVVAIKPNFKGTLKKGYKMSHYTLSSSTVTIYGKRSDLGDINAISCNVDISNLSGSTKLTGIALKQTAGINKMSLSTIDISMTIEKK